ncbi:hypothetical protein BLA29_005187 [Euroglyphus maynei]|uniref:Uncharacterized protein n=1 Tax=Euroglyphus maynei TaxID=6958 RepID=A0A1Y3BFQ4_EURMA|nr:hypothetical protein BLA29_005187 [Euroglyphus maynei]
MSQQSSTATIIIYISAIALMVHWSCIRAESSPASSNGGNWETDTIPSSQSKPLSSNNLNDISDRLYRIIYKRLTDTSIPSMDSYGSDLDDVDRFNRPERHLRFGKRFNARAKYSDLDYGHMRFGRR